MQNQIIVEISGDNLWADRNQRPTEANALHEQSRAENAGFQTPVFCIGDLSLSL
ncbi:hypothetical protein [Caenibius sp. WL]|uniref:hypothetical protein n=1 Tax=Caenibius sp. WL TaxID=2872646 RepID=UPI001C99A69B|nr:hypothetical protein [Caenibius sp. WL]QZP07222.1 hypothetical protein K5X80_10995 [Caenibius sp. WL]